MWLLSNEGSYFHSRLLISSIDAEFNKRMKGVPTANRRNLRNYTEDVVTWIRHAPFR